MKRILSLIVCVLLVGVLLMGCSPKTVMSPDDFLSKMKDEGFATRDVTDSTPGIAKTVILASNGSFQVEYFQLEDETSAKLVFENNKASAQELITNGVNTSVSAANYNSFSISGEGKAVVISQVGQTMLYCATTAEQKEAVETLFEKLGY